LGVALVLDQVFNFVAVGEDARFAGGTPIAVEELEPLFPKR